MPVGSNLRMVYTGFSLLRIALAVTLYESRIRAIRVSAPLYLLNSIRTAVFHMKQRAAQETWQIRTQIHRLHVLLFSINNKPSLESQEALWT